ncbi:recombinase family protein [Bacillus sp. 1P06AnD]|uniref:recombinase family protein n=1 Tax=Bacillus sp. 1P06AnD TaxID=3132208 RepID=UPI0039A2D109
MIIGYMRPSFDDTDCKKQMALLNPFECAHIVKEEHGSPKKRIQLAGMLEKLQAGDKIIAARLSALADSTRHLMEILQLLQDKKATVFFIDEQIDSSRDQHYSFISITQHLLAFQSHIISEKTKQGMDEAKQKGSQPGRPRKPDENVRKAIKMYQSKQYTLPEIKEQTGISKSTLYRNLEH